MVAYMKSHEAKIRRILESSEAEVDWSEIARYHRHRITDLQHERLVHVLVMLFVALFALLTFLAFVFHPEIGLGILALLFLGLLVPYVAHYFRLENGVQRLYPLADLLDLRTGKAPEPTLQMRQ